ncbi:MAG: PKD domain-containing protein, partial [candidate division WOR-3 bacterium]|nr:PKD domain-containing protein [candidate division WOR-3 bacterium]
MRIRHLPHLLLAAMSLILGCKQSQTPERPTILSGPSSGAVGIKYTFASCAEDSSSEDVAIRFDWGDGDTSLWSQWVRPGDTVTMSHTWTAPGTVHVRAQAKARHSAASDWSDELAMSS